MNSTSPAPEVRDDADQVARLLDRRPGGRAHRHAHLVADHVRERRLAEAGRTVQQHVIERLAALPRGGDRDVQVLADAVLPDVLVEPARPQPGLVLRVLVDARRGDEAVVRHLRAASRQRLLQRRSKLPSDASGGLDGGFDGFFGERPMIPQVRRAPRAHPPAARARRRRRRRPRAPPLARAAADPSARGRSAPMSSCRRRESRSAARRRRARSRGPAPAARCPTAPPAPPSGRSR